MVGSAVESVEESTGDLRCGFVLRHGLVCLRSGLAGGFLGLLSWVMLTFPAVESTPGVSEVGLLVPRARGPEGHTPVSNT